MLTLLVKDFKLMFAKDESAAKRALGILLRVLVLGIVVAVELFLFTAILDKIGHYSKAPRAFMVLFLLVVTAFMTVSSIFQAKKLFFNERDINQLSIHPITNSMQVLSKLVLLFLVHYAHFAGYPGRAERHQRLQRRRGKKPHLRGCKASAHRSPGDHPGGV